MHVAVDVDLKCESCSQYKNVAINFISLLTERKDFAAERAKGAGGPKSFTLRNRGRSLTGKVSGNGVLQSKAKNIAFDFKPYPDAEASSMRVSHSQRALSRRFSSLPHNTSPIRILNWLCHVLWACSLMPF